MPLKKSKPTLKARPPSPSSEAQSRLSAWKDERVCSEEQLQEIARDLAHQLRAGDRVLLEGPMGAGKTTFSRFLLLNLEVEQPPEGSPSFPIAHEYTLAPGGRARAVVHVDLYRIRSEEEIDERGLPDFFWTPEKIVISEWTSLWKQFEASVLKSGRNWRVSLDFCDEGASLRSVKITPPL